MNRKTVIGLAIGVFVYTNGMAQEDLRSKARTFVSAIFSDKPEAAVSMMDETMANAMPANAVRQFREKLTQQAGSFQSIKDVRVELLQNYQAAYVSCVFEKSTVNLRVVFTGNAKVGGLQIVS